MELLFKMARAVVLGALSPAARSRKGQMLKRSPPSARFWGERTKATISTSLFTRLGSRGRKRLRSAPVPIRANSSSLPNSPELSLAPLAVTPIRPFTATVFGLPSMPKRRPSPTAYSSPLMRARMPVIKEPTAMPLSFNMALRSSLPSPRSSPVLPPAAMSTGPLRKKPGTVDGK